MPDAARSAVGRSDWATVAAHACDLQYNYLLMNRQARAYLPIPAVASGSTHERTLVRSDVIMRKEISCTRAF